MIRCILNFGSGSGLSGFPLSFGSAGRLTFRALYPICFRRLFLLIILI